LNLIIDLLRDNKVLTFGRIFDEVKVIVARLIIELIFIILLKKGKKFKKIQKRFV